MEPLTQRRASLPEPHERSLWARVLDARTEGARSVCGKKCWSFPNMGERTRSTLEYTKVFLPSTHPPDAKLT